MKIIKVLSILVVIGILFSGCKSEQPSSQPVAAAPAPMAAAPAGDVNIGQDHTAAKTPTAIEPGSIAKAEGGHTVEELFTKKAELGGQKVSIHGKVVKFSPEIMGANWIHIQDGSGGTGTNDLTVTTQAVANVGDIVTISGILVLDKDFGSGYKYSLIIEDAEIKAD